MTQNGMNGQKKMVSIEVKKKNKEEANNLNNIQNSIDGEYEEFDQSLNHTDDQSMDVEEDQKDSDSSSSSSSSSSSDSSDSNSSEDEQEAREATVEEIQAEEEAAEEEAENEEEEDEIENGADDLDIVQFSQSSSSDDSSENSGSDSSEVEDSENECESDDSFVVPDDYEDSDVEPRPKKKSSKKVELTEEDKKRNRKRKKLFNYFCANEAELSGSEEEEEENAQMYMEYNIDKTLTIPEYNKKIYGAFFDYWVYCTLVPDWPEIVKKTLEDHKKSKATSHSQEQIDVMKTQVDSEKMINQIMRHAITFIIHYIQSRKTMDNACMTLETILFTKDGEDNLEFFTFEKNNMQSATCGITRSIIKRGQGWIVNYTFKDEESTKKIKSEIIDTKWVQFLSYWQVITKHTLIIEHETKKYFKGVPLKPFPQEMVKKFKSEENVHKYARMFMASLAFFYKFLGDSEQRELFLNKIDDRWYTVCAKNANNKE